jgi:hypothetical protein
LWINLITDTEWPGFDTDCKGAIVGSMMGMILGAEALPEKWTSIMHDTLHSAVSGYNVMSKSETAAELFRLFKKCMDWRNE